MGEDILNLVNRSCSLLDWCLKTIKVDTMYKVEH